MPGLYAATLGVASAGLFDAGDPAGAQRLAEQCLSQMAGLKGDRAQAEVAFYLLTGTVLGPEALLYADRPFRSYPLRVPAD